MNHYISNKLTDREKQVTYSLLIKVMDADNVQAEEEKSLLVELRDKLALSQNDVEQARKLSLAECKKGLLKFTDDKREYIKCLLKEMAMADGEFVQQEKELIDSLQLDISHFELQLIADWRDDNQNIVGYYSQKDDGKYYFDDIRSLGFTERTYKDGAEIAIEVPKIPGLEEKQYYEFVWSIVIDDSERGFHLVTKDNSFHKVQPQTLVDGLYQKVANSDPDMMAQMTSVQRMVNTQLTASSDGTFIYELLQNANDYPVIRGKSLQLVDVEFHLTDKYLIYRHTGRVFSPRNIAAISKISAGEKRKEKNAIGYKGIGFKTVFSENQYVYLKTGEYSLRFDQSITEESRLFPWQIMPIWTNPDMVDKDVIDIMSDNDEFRVQMAIRPDDSSKLREGDKSFEYIFNDIFQDEKDILFIPNIKSVKVYYDDTEQICRIKDPNKWALTRKPLVYTFSTEEIEENNAEVVANKRIPEKYKDFEDARFSFACRREGRKLLPVEKARIYCYLPTQVSLGFPFLMNTDMIPTGARDDFEKEVKFNHKLMTIAGQKLAEWISSLLHSGEFDLCSVFTIVPSFEEVKNYEVFIEEFKEGFDNALDDIELIPCEDGTYSKIYDTIIDETGLLSSGIMTDDEFLELADWEGNLPAKELRTNRKFKSFVKKYIDSGNVFDEDALHDMVQRNEFKEWLKDQDNNNKFLNFLLQEDLLENFFDEEIFIKEESGDLYKADDLYYDIEEELKDLSAFSNHLCYLSVKTREYFAKKKKWIDVTDGKFAPFEGENFIKNTLLDENKEETIKALEDWETSYHFYSFLAKNDIVPDELCNLPFFNVDSDVVEDFCDKFVFLSSAKGEKTCEAEWLNSVPIHFVSEEYDKATLDYLTENADVKEFSNEIIVNDIILSEEYMEKISNDINDDYSISKSFVDYCFHNRDLFNENDLNKYLLLVYDGEGDEQWYFADGDVFFQSPNFEYYSKKQWVDKDWIVALDSDYYTDGRVINQELKEFLSTVFGVIELDDEQFYNLIKDREYITDIIDKTQGNNDPDGDLNLDFVNYLDDNYSLIFEKNKDVELFESFVLLSDSNCDISPDESYIYAFDEELKEILDSEWSPSDMVQMCSRKYGESKSILAIKAKKYDFTAFFNDVITEELVRINDATTTKEASVAFHTFIIDRLTALTDKQKEVMKGAKVYLYGSEEPCDSSEGHKILSKSARELAEMGLVEFSDLDIIDPDYHIESHEDYWKTRLGNEQFTVTDFVNWLDENTDSFYETIEDEENNLNFWRWVKGCKLSASTLSSLPALPILLKSDEYVASDETIFLSDEYIDEGGIESMVRNYHEDASFISADYLKEEDDIESWRDFWIKLGIRFELVDILIDTIDNRLSETEDEKLPATLAKYRLKLEEHYEGNLISQLTDLKVKAHDGNFYDIGDVIYVNNGDEEPFAYIELPNQVTFETFDERKLILDIITSINGNKIDKLQEWQNAKIEKYIDIQNDEEQQELLQAIHYRFVDELAGLYNADRDNLKTFKNLDSIKLFSKDDEMEFPNRLTLGTSYNPFCEFERFGLEYDYLSDKYKVECKNDVRKMLNRIFNVHCNFKKDDIKNLPDRDFAIYFWSQYLIKREADITGVKKLIEDREFDDVTCIPTKDFMKKPTDIYSLTIESYVKKHVPDWENKLPLDSLPEIECNSAEKQTLFGLLLNGKDNLRLSFLDALYALFTITSQKRRPQLLQWMIETHDEQYDVYIDEYREDKDAIWKNSKNEDKQITELYALAYNEKMLEQYFGNLPQIINKDYLPAGPISFKNACDILKIKTIEAENLIVDPIGQVSKNDVYKRKLKLYALVLAGYEDINEWSTRYQKYCEQIEDIELVCCTSISIRYECDENICRNLKKFYHEKNTNEFYFVKSLDEKLVFKPFVESFIEYMGIEADKDFVEAVMDNRESALETAKENNSLMLDEAFKDALDELIPGIKRELSGNEAVDDERSDDGSRKTFTAPASNGGDDAYGENEERTTSEETGNIEREQPSSRKNNHTEVTTGNSSTPATGTLQNEDGTNTEYNSQNKGEHIERGGCSDKGGTHDYPTTIEPRERTATTTTRPTRASEGTRRYTDMGGWEGSRGSYTPQAPKPFSPEDVRNFGSHGVTRTLEVLEPTKSEVADINRILGEELSPEQVADQNYLAQLRLYNNLVKKGMTPNESKDDFVRNAHMKNEHTINGGKYIHKCSAAGGIMYLSPSIWNKIADDRCVVCVYLGAKSNEFMYFNSIDDILEWVGEDDIVIKLTGEEKADVVEELYSGVLNGVKGTAYTLIRINSNEKYNSLFAQLPSNNEINETEEYEDEY